ncbi:hypothetical protein Smlt2144A [Stenotrophomonas maltophilia K279a]|uniref:Uncharacterized protein n=1 Tax=Stenotrophomonas maltophilia (strain K279a) TaxID=522373 RepID=B2FPK4_STRMK|nr:hypothetical protein Smlt2144A [Stenotrophomonas maltophilia K279a]
MQRRLHHLIEQVHWRRCRTIALQAPGESGPVTAGKLAQHRRVDRQRKHRPIGKLALAQAAASQSGDVDVASCLQDALLDRCHPVAPRCTAGNARHHAAARRSPCQLVESCRVLHQPMQALGGQVRQRPADVGDGAQWHGASLTE